MKNKVSYTLIITLLFLFACGDENALSPDEKSQRGTISGKVTDESGSALSGVDVATDNGSHDDVTGTDGTYEIPDVETGTYKVTFTRHDYHDTSISDISIAKMGQVVDLNVAMTFNPNDNFEERDVFGSLSGNTDLVARIEVILTGDSIPEDKPMITPMGWDSDEKSFSRFIYRPKEGDQWLVEVKVYDSLDRVIGYKEKKLFNLAGDISINEFNCENAKPVIHYDTLATQQGYPTDSDTKVAVSVTDSWGENVSLSYKIKGDTTYHSFDKDTLILRTPSHCDANFYTTIKAIDSDSNIVTTEIRIPTGVWKKEFDKPYIALDIKKDSDDNLYISFETGTGKDSFAKYDKDGNKEWIVNTNGEISDVVKTSEENFIFVERTSDTYYNLLHYNRLGTCLKWEGIYAKSTVGNNYPKIALDQNNNIYSVYNNRNSVLLKSKILNDTIWKKKIPANNITINNDRIAMTYRDDSDEDISINYVSHYTLEGDLIGKQRLDGFGGGYMNLLITSSNQTIISGSTGATEKCIVSSVSISEEESKLNWQISKEQDWLFEPYEITECSDKSILCFNTQEILKVSENGDILWEKDFLAENKHSAFSTPFVILDDGGIIVVNYRYMTKFDSEGNTL